MATLSSIQPPFQLRRISLVLTLVLPLFALISLPVSAHASGLLEITELLSHPEQYDRQEVVVTGQVTNVQLATNRQGQPAYGFLLKDSAGTLKVISLGQVEVREGDQVIVEGIFARLRQAGRTIIYNEIKALSIKPLNRLNPDLVG
ncbi:MAG: cytochrome c maturation protein CcmE [Nitrospirae bacterium]|nr:cytochrome c maturation protein CcmE [Nitrospirota bacterium]